MRTSDYRPVQWPTREPVRACVHDDGGPSLLAAMRAVRDAPVRRTPVASAPSRWATWARRWRESVAWWRVGVATSEEPGGPDE